MSIYDQVVADMGIGPKYTSRKDYTKYFGYAAGNVIGKFDSTDEAKKAGAATTEKVFDKDAYDAANDAYRAHNTNIMQEWTRRLKVEHSEVNEATFNILYAAAYDDSHSYGLHEVEQKLGDYVELANKIIAAQEK